ncbi:MAG TPA: hypothetical protein VEY50_11640 [Lysobacter sp.]|nr:hypothetical protein [Lysobacter sp.]
MSVPHDPTRVHGWGADLDPTQRPAVPMERTPPRLDGVHWDEPEQQQQNVEVLRSVERPTITPVFGTSVPPSGLSGVIRRAAYRLSENDIRHWLMLMAADRVNVVEGVFDDVRETRWGRRLTHPVVLGGAAVLAGMWLARRSRRS